MRIRLFLSWPGPTFVLDITVGWLVRYRWLGRLLISGQQRQLGGLLVLKVAVLVSRGWGILQVILSDVSRRQDLWVFASLVNLLGWKQIINDILRKSLLV